MYDLYERLRSLREQRGLTQSEVAEQLFLTRQTISNWENGRTEPDLQSLGRLCALYGVQVCEVIGDGPNCAAKPQKDMPLTDEQRRQIRRRALRSAAIWGAAAVIAAGISAAISVDLFRWELSVFGSVWKMPDPMTTAGRMLIEAAVLLRPMLFWYSATFCVSALLSAGGKPRLALPTRIVCGFVGFAVTGYVLLEFVCAVAGMQPIAVKMLLFVLQHSSIVFPVAAVMLFLSRCSKKEKGSDAAVA